MKLKSVYIKEFSKIGTIQSRKTIEYNICESELGDFTIYGVHLREKKRAVIVEKIVNHVSSDYCKVLDILQFLYENSVSPVNAKDIVEDLLHE